MRPLDSMDETSRRFYARVFNNAMINMLAVRYGFFDTLLADMTMPSDHRRWMETLPDVYQRLRQLGVL